MLLARTLSLRCAPLFLGRRGTVSGGGGGAGPLHARAKRGAATSAPSDVDQAAEQAAAATETPDEPAAAAPDLSAHVPVGERWQPATLPQQWVVFSDLHVSHKTRATALAVLERVHEEAARRNAGILFLGDFWHTRGTLPVEPLNEVVQQLAAWRQPTLMLPGNHDQVSLGGLVHALTPLAAANPAIHAFDGPSLFLDALWLPYRREPAALEAALAAASCSPAPLRAVFAHADIVGAMMNEAYQAHDGLPPELFPQQIPTYTGHYHKPHTVAGTRITYIGSPFQVTRAEAGQRKRLLLLDRAAGWEAIDQLPLDIGPRYFVAAAARAAAPPEATEAAAAEGAEGAAEVEAAAAVEAAEAGAEAAAAEGEAAASAAELQFELQLPEGLRRGDRLLLTLPAAAAKQHAKQLRKLERQGIEVEVFTPPEAAAAPRIAAAEGMGPLQLWNEYCAWQRLSAPAMEAGAGLLRGLLGGAMGGTRLEQAHAAIEFEAVEVEGYFSFRDPVRYELGQRGLVVVTGQVHDTAEAGVESNGAGKTALMMAPLWALTGSVDSRAEGASAARPVLADIIHDGAKRARVRVEGRVNGAPFWVERTANKKASSVAFHLDGEDLTTQENRLTQARIDETLGADLLGRVVFYGQSDIAALLEASDRAFKQELAKLVDLRVWEAAKEASRRELSGRRDALRDAAATLREREQQAGTLREQLQGLQAAAAEWEQQATAVAAALRQEAGLLLGRVRQQHTAAAGAAAAGQQRAAELEVEAAQLAQRVQRLEAQLASEQRGAGELAAAEQQLGEQQAHQRSLQEQQQQRSRQLGAASAATEEAARQQAAAREAAAAASAALDAFLRLHPHLAAGRESSGSGSGRAVEAELEELLGRQQLLSRELQQAEAGLTAAREAAAAQRSRLQAKQEAAQRAQQEAEAAAEAVQRQQAAVQASGAAEALSMQDVKKQRRSMQRRLATAQQRMGAAQGQARERAQQLEEYRALVEGGGSNSNSSSGSSGSGGGAVEQNGAGRLSRGSATRESVAVLEQHEHKHSSSTAVCDRCAQPISPELFQRNVQRLEAEAAAAAAKAAKEELQIAGLERAAADLEVAAAAAEQAAQQHAALEAAEATAAARAAEAEAASAEASNAAVAAQESEGLVAEAQHVVDDLRVAAAQLASAISAAEAAAALEQQRQELLWAAGDAAQAEAAASQRRQQAEQQQVEAAASLEGLEAATADAAASVAALQQRVQQLGQGQQEAALLRSQQQAAEQQRRLQQQRMEALADLGRQLEAAAQELGQLGSSSSNEDELDVRSAGDTSSSGSIEQLEAAAAAARSAVAAAAELQQRWRLQQQQPNLPARDAGLVQQQLEAAEAAIAEVERRHAELEGEVGVWKQVDDALLPRGVPNFVVEGVLGDLQAAASRNLGALTSGMTLTLSPCKPAGKRKDAPEGGTFEQIEKIVHVRQPGSLEMRPRSVRQLSGGERRRVALALALGFSELAAQRGRLRSNLVVLDEVMQHLDGEGCLRVAQLLKQLPYSSVLVVAQAHSLQTQVFDATDVVVKSGGHSRVEQGSSAAVS